MQLKVKSLKFFAGRPIAILNKSTADRINVHINERILISANQGSIVSLIDVSNHLVSPEEIAVSEELVKSLGIKNNDLVEVSLVEKPISTLYIKKKLDGGILEHKEIFSIIKDIVGNALTEAEIAYFVSAVYKNGMNSDEIEGLIHSMVSTGQKLSFPGKVVDKHSIGGLAGNRTTPIIVSICASAGLTMPKTSSRAITSAAGTADVIESIAEVELSIEEIKKIVEKTGACLAWGGSLGISPADDKLIRIERVLNLDPEPQLLASVLSKKISAGSKYVIIDIPYGKSAKVQKGHGEMLKKHFESLAKKFHLNLKCVLTPGNGPIGRGIGPLLEIRDVIAVLKRDEKNAPKDLENKAVFLTGQIFELCEKSKKGEGENLARQILDSGKAFEKFKQIIEAQRGKVPSLEEIEERLGKYRATIFAKNNSKLIELNNKKLSLVANIAGSPMDKGSGIFLNSLLGSSVKKGDKVLTIYSDSQSRLKAALNLYNKLHPASFSR